MANLSEMRLMIDFTESGLDPEELEELTQHLYQQMDLIEEVKQVERFREVPPEGSKAGAKDIGKWLSGILATTINLSNLTQVVQFLFTRLTGKKVKLKAEVQGRAIELETTGATQEEVFALIKALKDFAKAA